MFECDFGSIPSIEWSLFVLLFCLIDREAEIAWVVSVECFNHPLNDSGFLGIGNDHLCPSDHLKRAVVAATEVEAADDDDE